MKSTDTSRTACAALAACLLAMTFAPVLVLGGCNNSAVLTGVRDNAVRTLAEIKSYHAVVEVSSPGEVYSMTARRREHVEDARIETDEIWVRGPDLSRCSSESFDRQIEEMPSSLTSITNGSTFALMGSDNIQIDYNCPPDLYWPRGSSYDLARELSDLTQEDAFVFLGEENVNGTATYKLEKRYDEDEGQGTPEREVVWVDQASSICRKKETYEQGRLWSTLVVISLELNAEIPDSAFFIDTEGWQYVEEKDMGYREIALEQVPGTCGFEPLLPSALPEGYMLASTGWRDESVDGLPLDLPVEQMPLWYKPLYLTCADDGITPVVICEAKEYETERNDETSLGIRPGRGPVQQVDLAGGITGYYWNSTLYFLRDGIKVSISAYLPLEELVSIAGSLR